MLSLKQRKDTISVAKKQIFVGNRAMNIRQEDHGHTHDPLFFYILYIMYQSPSDFLISSTLAFAFSTSSVYWQAQVIVSLISQ